MEKKSILEKIKKCLALANSDNPNEAALAMSRAQDMMEKYGITQQALDLSEIQTKRALAAKTEKIPAYVSGLANACEDAFGCSAIFHGVWPRGWAVQFIGYDPNPEIAAYCFEVVLRQMLAGRRRALASLPKRMKRKNKTKAADYWAIGFVSGILKNIIPMAVGQEQKDKIAQWKSNKYGEIKKGKAFKAEKMSQMDTTSFFGGLREGMDLRLHKAAPGADRNQIGG